MSKLAIVGIFFDGYIDLWNDFFGLMAKNWSDCPYPIYLVDNSAKPIDVNFHGFDVTVLNAGNDAEYSRKVQTAVNEIDADYFLLLLEDFYFVKKVDNSKIADILKTIEENGLNYYTMPMPEFIGNKEPDRYKDTDVYSISTERKYVFSCQPSIWRKDLLQLCIGKENYNAWVFEGIYAKTPCVRRSDFLAGAVVSYDNPLNLRHGALQGKMLPKTIKAIEECGYKLTTTRQTLSLMQMIKKRIKLIGKNVLRFPLFKGIEKKFKKNSVLERYSDQIAEFADKTISEEKINNYLKNR